MVTKASPTRQVVGAHYGLNDWLIQRITAVVLGSYFFYFVLRLVAMKPSTFALWHDFFNPFTQFFSMIAAIAMCWHAWIGVRDIYMDYIKPVSLRLFLHALTLAVLIGYVAWAGKVLFQVG